ncbi:MAG TPA: type II secretion system F family protein [Alphaproteobacteria bacterium]|nr:type II secretion system F family protein [Alphaproteobacteria bacterium]
MAQFQDPNFIVPLVFSGLAFLTIVGLGLPWLQPDMFAARLKVIKRRREELSQQRRHGLEQQRPSFRRVSGHVELMRKVLEKLKLKNIAEQPELKKKLVRAGWRGPAPMITFTFLRLVLPFVAAGTTALFVFGSSGVHAPTLVRVAICLAAAAIGYYLPTVLVSNAVGRRQQELQRAFPDGLDLTVICVESGLSLDAAFSRVADELDSSARALAEEIGLTTAELTFLSDRRQALENLAERTGTAPVKALVTALIQSERYGTPLGTALRVVSQESRDARMAKAEEKAASLPAKLTVPMVTFFLPVLFLVLIGPMIIQVIQAFHHG